jgi:iron-sulfur cluster repair protein YtfE (RIC family)
MTTIRDDMERDHHACDALHRQAVACVVEDDWRTATEAFGQFRARFEQHLGREELTVFPHLERAFGGAVGPTSAMRAEHAQQRGLIALMADAVDAHAAADYLDLADTLRALMRQHAQREESLLYPMIDRLFNGRIVALLVDLQAQDAHAAASANAGAVAASAP